MITKTQDLLLLHASILLFGGTALFSKLIPLGATDITVFRTLLAALALFVVLTVRRQKVALDSSRDVFFVVIFSLLMGAHWVTYFLSMQLASVSVGVIAFFTYPIMTILLEPLVSNTKLHGRDIASGLVVILGVYLLVPEVNLENTATQGILFALLSAFLFTLRNVLQKKVLSHCPGTKIMFYQTLIAGLSLSIFVETPPTDLDSNTIYLLLLAGFVFTAMPHALFASVLRRINAKTVALIGCLQPFYATVLAMLVLNESPTLHTLIGGILIVSTSLYETVSAFDNRETK